MNKDAIVQLVLMLGIPAFMMCREYKKMSEEERNEVRTDFTSKRFIFSVGLVALSWVVLLLEPIFEMTWMKTVGIALISIGGLVGIVLIWLNASLKRKAVPKIIYLLILFSILFWVNY
ncbi:MULTISPECIES: hypothetical protein [Peribacillus]|uniref:hypothetical protein n=1 Tax=Peribacillus TaxID=2675229 RepID=UPI001F4D58D4|nr:MULTISPECIES: hypothetical protein [unclassified Peribacillus]MCK1981384.1 hypothetical protein [Peribacillus sp. Aquil_B1]MCK2006869.1 hypothetical protein [Peribacillus sp. Aquil_B8]